MAYLSDIAIITGKKKVINQDLFFIKFIKIKIPFFKLLKEDITSYRAARSPGQNVFPKLSHLLVLFLETLANAQMS